MRYSVRLTLLFDDIIVPSCLTRKEAEERASKELDGKDWRQLVSLYGQPEMKADAYEIRLRRDNE